MQNIEQPQTVVIDQSQRPGLDATNRTIQVTPNQLQILQQSAQMQQMLLGRQINVLQLLQQQSQQDAGGGGDQQVVFEASVTQNTGSVESHPSLGGPDKAAVQYGHLNVNKGGTSTVWQERVPTPNRTASPAGVMGSRGTGLVHIQPKRSTASPVVIRPAVVSATGISYKVTPYL